ncbi:MAG TPA: DUF503 domain-containing protein [Clostridia bacterium]|nr:DUF503 domain-containing protein [Clostridia bacterium]
MFIAALEVELYAPWVHSLKEKRMIVKSLIARIRNKFNVSAAEVDQQDVHQKIVLGIACVAGNTALADSILNNVIAFIESSTEAEIIDIQREIR